MSDEPNVGGNDRQRSKLLTRHRFKLLVCVFVVSYLTFHFFIDRKTRNGKQILIEISPQTTIVTEPLDDLGFVDYAAYLNRKISEGVTPENNAVVLYWKAIGPLPDTLTPEYREKLVELLGVDVFSETAPYLTTLEQFAKEYGDSAKQLDWFQLNQLRDDVAYRPWKDEDYPLIKDWIRFNEKPLHLATEGSRRVRYFSPLIKKDSSDPLFATILPVVNEYRSIAYLLQARAMNSLGEGRVDAARDDIMTIYRLARHAGSGVFLIEGLLAHALDAIALEGVRQVALHGGMNSGNLLSWRKELISLGHSTQFDRVFDEGERFSSLDTIQWLARSSITGEEDASEWIRNPEAKDLFLSSSINWNFALPIVNEPFEFGVKAFRTSNMNEREALLGKLQQRLEEYKQQAKTKPSYLEQFTANADYRGQKIGKIFRGILSPAFIQAEFSETRNQMKKISMETAFAILAYRADHGHLPAELVQLVPDYCESLPIDVYTETPLTYQTRGDEFAIYSLAQNRIDDQCLDVTHDSENHDHGFVSDKWFDEEFFEE